MAQLNVKSKVTREPFGLGVIDRIRECDGYKQYHVTFEHVAGWFSGRALTLVTDASHDAEPVDASGAGNAESRT